MMNLDQIRAHRAFEKALLVGSGGREGYLSLARTLPAMFQNDGFLATWAFLLSKKEPQHGAMLEIMLEHFRDSNFDLKIPERMDAYHLFADYWTNPDSPVGSDALMKLTRESIIFSGWVKRGAEAFCDR